MPSSPHAERPTLPMRRNGEVRKATNGTLASGARIPASKPPPSRLSRPGDVAKATRPPPSRLSRPGDVARSAGLPKAASKSRQQSRIAEVRAAQKRKSASPAAPTFDSDSEGESEAEIDSGKVSKKPRTSAAPMTDIRSRIRDPEAWSRNTYDSSSIISGADLVTGVASKDYVDAFDGDEDESSRVELAYPSAAPHELFKIVKPKRDDYNPHDDICETMRHVLQNYLPAAESRRHLDEATGLPYRLTRAYNRRNFDDYKKAVMDFNSLLDTARNNGALQKSLDNTHVMPLAMVQRILNQVAARTVSPYIHTLKDAEPFSRNVYGELLAPFNSHVFRETGMTSSSVFLDLGSGVGNVVLQAALEVGCESHGIEEMPKCCRLARAQEIEFNSRCRMWGLSHGPTNLLEGDFLEDPRLGAILPRVDVILVNNYIFPAAVNDQLTRLFLDLKDGAKIVSLKSFVPVGWQLDERKRESVQGTLEVEQKDFWTGCVSWSASAGKYFVATKDSGRIERILGKSGDRR